MLNHYMNEWYNPEDSDCPCEVCEDRRIERFEDECDARAKELRDDYDEGGEA